MADMVKRFNTPDCESGMHGFDSRYPPQETRAPRDGRFFVLGMAGRIGGVITDGEVQLYQFRIL